jgi:outer membrane protein OmpA-like peptidoglycan-associated protein
MMIPKTAWIVGVSLAAAVATSGCATKGFVRDQVGAVDEKVTATNGRVDNVDRTANEALSRATAAGKLAEGKFLYSVVLSDDSVKFPVNHSELSPEAESRLTELAEKMKADNRNVYLEIQGHTDASGGPDYNKKLGEDRAEAVRLFLNKQGVALNRMATISYGQEAPVADNQTREGRAQNRRVVIVVLN